MKMSGIFLNKPSSIANVARTKWMPRNGLIR